MVTNLEAILAVIVYLLGGTFIIYVYEAYHKTHQKNLLYLAIGMFIMIFGSNFDTLAGIIMVEQISVESSKVIALGIEIPGILIILYSAIK
ncbi:MAG: hypothetical protein P1P69_08810 [Methanosarcinaceae archaeon]|nr:hypothetical protein [Methanosarcinaceae archaeon]MDF1534583.1 hypothetical protein [Methanosarcinaceae archaeon]